MLWHDTIYIFRRSYELWGGEWIGALSGSSQGVTAPVQLRDVGGLALVEGVEMGAPRNTHRSACQHMQQPHPVTGPGRQWGPPAGL